MRVVHLSTTDSGGAFKATIRISESLQTQAVESSVLVRTRYHGSETIEVMDSVFKKICSKVRNGINLLFSKGDVVSDLFGADLSKIPQIADADIIILHWVNSFVSAGTIRKLKKIKKPIIWVMHDMWVFTGGCHYDGECGKYKEVCGACPLLRSSVKTDRTYKNLHQKKTLYAEHKITFIALSEWELECAKNSNALKECKIKKIFNPLNVNVFRPMDRQMLQTKKTNTEKKIILFGASRSFGDDVKGFKYLLEALRCLDKDKYCAVCFGGNEPKGIQSLVEGFEISYLGQIYEEEELAIWYNIADVFVAPSLQETFCYTVCEALSCGTPVAAFAIGGILDQVNHKENGYLAKVKDAKDLARGIEYCVQNREKLAGNAREGVLQKNTYEIIGKEYEELCRSVLKQYNGE